VANEDLIRERYRGIDPFVIDLVGYVIELEQQVEDLQSKAAKETAKKEAVSTAADVSGWKGSEFITYFESLYKEHLHETYESQFRNRTYVAGKITMFMNNNELAPEAMRDYVFYLFTDDPLFKSGRVPEIKYLWNISMFNLCRRDMRSGKGKRRQKKTEVKGISIDQDTQDKLSRMGMGN